MLSPPADGSCACQPNTAEARRNVTNAWINIRSSTKHTYAQINTRATTKYTCGNVLEMQKVNLPANNNCARQPTANKARRNISNASIEK